MQASLTSDGTTATLFLGGELDAFTAPMLQSLLDQLASGSDAAVVLELSGLRLIDSVGVVAIVSLWKRLNARRARLTVVGLTNQPRAVWRLLQLDRVMASSKVATAA